MDKAHLESFIPISIEELRIGLYVYLDCPWYRHPFARNQFKLSAAREIQQIRNANIVGLYYDPKRSDPPDGSPESGPQQSNAPPPSRQSANIPTMSTETPTGSPRRRISSDYQNRLRAANKTYCEVVNQAKEIVRLVSGGNAEGFTDAQKMVGDLVHTMVDEEMSLGMADLVNVKRMDRHSILDSMNVTILSMLVGRELRLDRDQLRLLGIGALFHDIGLQRLPSQLLHKIGPMTRTERRFFELHTQYGKDMAMKIASFPPASLAIIEQHHEKLDGSGYPHQLRGPEISWLAQIVRVVDAYGYLISPRNDGKRFTPGEALAELYVNHQKEYSREVMTALIRVLSVYPPGTFVELTDGSVGIVVGINMEDRMRPWVALLEGGDIEHPEVRNLAEEEEMGVARQLQLTEFPAEIVERINPAQLVAYLLIDGKPYGQEGDVCRSGGQGDKA